MRWQEYNYDSLNRLNWAREVLDGGTEQWKQQFTNDRWGTRTINTGVTYGTGINNKSFTVNTANNRLGVPGGYPAVMTYDVAGNLTNDTYTGMGGRTYDAENKITQAADNTGQVSRYTYDSERKRVKRQVASGQEEWQIYGFGAELLAEYRASSPASSPQKEYAYRNGQLLVTATGRFNVALAANGGVATASSTATGSGFSATYAINGNYRGPWGNSVEGWNDNTSNVVPDWIQLDFAGSKTIDEISVFSLHDNYTVENTPTETQTFTLYGLLNFDVQYWNGSTWVTVPGGSVTGNNKVWRKFTFSPITTSKIRVHITSVPDSWSRVVEVQAFGTSAGDQKVQWLISDQLGTPRMVLDQSGALANMKRHDYLPFGEELIVPTSGRSAAMGYSGGDGIRQQFTSQERDVETGLDYFSARYYGSVQGRFTGVDAGPFTPVDPQNLNRYSYVQNNPLKFVDPSGRDLTFIGADADYMVAELMRLTGFTLIRDPKSGRVTIDNTKKRKTKGTSTYLANKVAQIVADKRVNVKIETTRSEPGVFFDAYDPAKLDVDDYNAFKKADDKFGAQQLGHVLEEYYYEQLIPFAGTNDPGERPAGESRGSLTRPQRYPESHAAGSGFQSLVLSDFTGWWEKPYEDKKPVATPYGELIVTFEFSTVTYYVTTTSSGTVTYVSKDEKKKPRK
jgi:RHS repeat-associated protein